MIHLGAIERLERNAKRVGEVFGVLAKYGPADWLKGIPISRVQHWFQSIDGQPISQLNLEERVRLALTELGTTYIKLGQLLSTRPDLAGGVDVLNEFKAWGLVHGRNNANPN
jgi:ubiquinone biosynthesis protein